MFTKSKIPWLDSGNATKIWEKWKNEEPLNQLNKGAGDDIILPEISPRRPGYLRVVAVSDTHSRSLLKMTLPPGDVLVHAGDLTMWGTEKETRLVAKEFEELLQAEHFNHIIVIPGNHDEYLESLVTSKQKNATKSAPFNNPKIHFLLDESYTIDGVKFYGSPWVPVYRNWAFMLNRGNALNDVWKKIPNDTNILITHTPPLGALDLADSDARAGCLSLTAHVLERVQPAFHVFGHIHECHGVLRTSQTTFVNAAICNRSYKPLNRPIVFDVQLPNEIGLEQNSDHSGLVSPMQELLL